MRVYRLQKRLDEMEKSRATIIHVARNILSTSKPDDFSLELIASESGVTRATIYNHFQSKSGLLHAVCDSLVESSGFNNVDDIVNDMDPWSALRKYVAGFADLYAIDQNLFRRLSAMGVMNEEFGKVIQERTDRKRKDGLIRILTRIHLESAQKVPSKAVLASQVLMLKALLCFEVFDTLSEGRMPHGKVSMQLQTMVLSVVESFLKGPE